jgi:ArsR family transcriptional regulator, lead/cadmium/zinc/bismuth-responsive transcriptional repressor
LGYIYKILQEIVKLNYKVDALQKQLNNLTSNTKAVPVKNEWTSLPDHLRQTMTSLSLINNPASAQDVSVNSGKCRAMESSYLNQLVRLGYINKKRESKTVIFSIVKKVL